MFYSQFILAKKGPLGTIWIAAHLERKLRKNQVADTDIGVSVDSILCPDVPIALRLSSHLLLGVARIYSKKVNYLFDDCSEALLKVKQAFRSAAVDLPPEESKAPYHSITLPETFELDDFELPDNDIFHGNYVDNHVSSREQITLQDTLDGVTYSTSKFGLDERFGDGDASGLDFDEELFLAKVDAAGIANESFRSDPVASVGPMTPLKQDEHPESRSSNSGTRVDDVGDNADLMEYAHAPCTPRLVEGPSLPNVLEVSACNDHMELEYHLGESTMIDNAKNNIYGNKQEVDWSSQNNKNSDAVRMVLPEEEYGHQSGSSVINSSKPEGEFPVDTNKDHLPVETLSGSVPFMEDLQSGQVGKDINSALPVDDNDDHQGPHETGFVKSSCENDESVPQSHGTMASNEPGDSSSLNFDVHEKVASSESPFMRACNSNLDQHDLIPGCTLSADAAVQSDVTELVTSGREETIKIGHVCPGADNSEEFSKENHTQDCGAALDERDSQATNASAHAGLVDNRNNSAETNLPAPEKMLSVPEDVVDQHNNMISPGEFIGLDNSDAGSKVVSGKKRSFTESTLTEQSLNSVESSRLVHFKRTAESVPDDDDLLSSILVGRSSVLKVKTTPRPSELASNKRARSAPRSGGPKRKVLMDDTMVLHGDTIRQQLTDADDIRRVRKKAPCTQSEISLLQRQYLEDESFLEPLFTGMSIELVSLHSQTRDLSGIQIITNDLNDSFESFLADLKRPSENVPLQSVKDVSPTATPISCPDGAKNDDSPTTAVEADSTSQKAENFESLDMENDMDSGRDNLAEQSKADGDIGINEIHEMNIESNEQSQADGDVYADVLRQEPLLDVGGVETSDKDNDASGPSASAVQRNPTTETYEADLRNQEKNALSPELHFATTDADKVEAISEDALTARDADADAAFETEPLVRDNVLLEEVREGATVEMQFDEHSEMHYAVVGENVEYSSNAALQEDDFVEYGRSPEHPEAHHQYVVQEQNFVAAGNENDTEFLNFDDDDELNEMADDHIPDEEEARFMENTGWSSRTRAVSKYLQTLFVKEAEQGRRSLSIENLLVGKSRKEASRMFFETLVLKTRDYIHVEQRVPFDSIAIKPRTRLMKSGF